MAQELARTRRRAVANSFMGGRLTGFRVMQAGVDAGDVTIIPHEAGRNARVALFSRGQ